MKRLPIADKKLVRNRALVWLYLAVRQFATTDGEVHAALANLIYPEGRDSRARGASDVFQHLRWFKEGHSEEYQQIKQYLEDRPCPTGNELVLFVFFGAPVPANSQ